ncbi:MAG: hypothetical protein KME23_28915 [Goleter apudmare HA4340-LM2]|jgi:hypothetical protein|nr:hypothetical protein [Goleter apudmare HA4340-LM2]
MQNKHNVTNSKKLHNPQLWVDINQPEQASLSGGTGNNPIANELTHTIQQSSIPPGRIVLWFTS